MQGVDEGRHKNSQCTRPKDSLEFVAALLQGGTGASCRRAVQVSSSSRVQELLMTRPVLADPCQLH